MATFTITRTAIAHEIHNAVVTLICKSPDSAQPHEVKVYVSDILMGQRGIAGNDAAIISAARAWAEPELSKAPSISAISELRMHTASADT